MGEVGQRVETIIRLLRHTVGSFHSGPSVSCSGSHFHKKSNHWFKLWRTVISGDSAAGAG